VMKPYLLAVIAVVLCSAVAGCPPRKPEPLVTDSVKSELQLVCKPITQSARA
jgi:hypothetical protein